jgi:SAM-dependent methyltransferase
MLTSLKQFVKARPRLKQAMLAILRLVSPIVAGFHPLALLRYPRFIAEYRDFNKKGGHARIGDVYPCLFDRTATSGIDTHYFHQAIWAFRHIKESAVDSHVDIGSEVNFVGLLTCITHVTFVDIRPLELDILNYTGLNGSIVNLPFTDGAVQSLSCLHVIEHIGLGRYGDPIDPRGPECAGREIARVLRAGGRAYISTPVGRPRVQFNGQRVFAIAEVIEIFRGLALVEFSLVDAHGTLREKIDAASADIREDGAGLDCGLGMFVFQKPAGPNA